MPRHYTVVWEDQVLQDFAQLWTDSESELRNRLTKAASIIDRQLLLRPDPLGKPLPWPCKKSCVS